MHFEEHSALLYFLNQPLSFPIYSNKSSRFLVGASWVVVSLSTGAFAVSSNTLQKEGLQIHWSRSLQVITDGDFIQVLRSKDLNSFFLNGIYKVLTHSFKHSSYYNISQNIPEKRTWEPPINVTTCVGSITVVLTYIKQAIHSYYCVICSTVSFCFSNANIPEASE